MKEKDSTIRTRKNVSEIVLLQKMARGAREYGGLQLVAKPKGEFHLLFQMRQSKAHKMLFYNSAVR